ncbi:MAG: GHKL domain-containing protein [Nitrososphaeraceae archaeon]|nr:GHKL domain-containing protein [Nitrososphaeraceae archaeon]
MVNERTEIFYGIENVMNTILQFLYQSRGKIDAYVDYTRPPLAVDIEVLKSAFLDARKRGVKLRYATEITKDNISYCKQMMTMVDELRHLDGIKGNFYISEAEYLAPATFHEAGKPAAQIIYSNVKELIEHQRYVFETLWSKTIPAEQRIREIEEGTVHYETRIMDNSEQIIKEISSLTANSNLLDACLSSGGMHYSHKYFFNIKKKLLERQKRGGHKGIRYVTELNNENIKLAKLYLDSGIQLRHLSNLPPLSFGVSDKKIAVTIEKMKEGKVVQSLLLSNEPKYLEHFSSVFQELWENGVDANERIREIEEGTEPAKIEIIRNSKEAVALSYKLVKSAKHEILRIYPSMDQFHRQVRIGALHLFREALERGLSVKVLVPGDAEQINKIVDEVQLALPHLEIRSLDKSLQTQIGILVVDRKESMIIELKDDTKDNYYDAAGLAAYSNSKPIGVSYASIFETLWKQGELYEQLKSYNTMQREFINIAAHELRTPVQPILGLSQVLLSGKSDKESSNELLRVINRNAERLQHLIEDILDVTRIEGQSLRLKMESFNLNDLISNAISEYKSQIERQQSHKELVFNAKEDIITIKGDKGRISQVISNLLSNAVKFTEEGDSILVSVEKKEDDEAVIISVKDTGIGINSEIFPRLFTKFASKSDRGGTGLGLFISKSIVDAHRGAIWAENNPDGNGANFIFSLPLATKT